MSNGSKRSRDWYSVSLASVLRLLVFVLLLGAFFFSGIGFKKLERFNLEKQAGAQIERALELKRQVEQDSDFDPMRTDYVSSVEQLREAQSAFGVKDFASALEQGTHSVLGLESLLQIGQRSGGSIRFLNLHGTVEFRRGERGAWKRIRPKDRLNPGDWVKTSADGTAEIMFPDRSVYTLRQNTMVHLGDSTAAERGQDNRKPSTDLVFGWVELNTSRNASTVTTPQSKTRVEEKSEALVSYDRERQSARIAAFQGAVEVQANNGQTRRLGPLEQVEQAGERLSETQTLPARPRPLEPADKQELSVKAGERITLSWSSVPGARRYALRVSNSPLFGSTIVSSNNRPRANATLGVRSGGSFYWQAAAIDRAGLQGPWSPTASFRVIAQRTVSEAEDKTPPALEVYDVQSYGSLAIVNGKVEPGASITINGEPVSPLVDGSFNKTVELNQEGWSFIEVIATDAWGNATRTRRRVFVDAI